MCGIVGIVSLNGEEQVQAYCIHKMTRAIRHRGPDDEGYLLVSRDGCYLLRGDDTGLDRSNVSVSNPHTIKHIRRAYGTRSYIALGHRRLSILDLTPAGRQPMNYLERYWIVYNGEIYNYPEIRKELECYGYSFDSRTDTEVILAAYDKWGSNCLVKFNGMWAFVIYDSKSDKLFMSRDRFGIKPLYYYKDDEKLIFASEIKAILAHPNVETSPNIRYCKKYLAEGPMEYIKETAFNNIYRFAPASFLEESINGLRRSNIQEQKFWSLSPNPRFEKFDRNLAEAYARKYYQLLHDAVKIRLRADVKIGAALSGGLDSSSITLVISKYLQKMGMEKLLETFSSVYKSKETRYCDESPFIEQLAGLLNVKSNQIEPRIEDIVREYEKMVYAMECPAIGPNMGGWYTFKCVKRSNVKVNLDGQGADEQLAGYLKYVWRYFLHLDISQIPSEFVKFSRIPGIKKRKIIAGTVVNLLKKILPKKALVNILKKAGLRNPESVFTPLNEILYQDVIGSLMNLIHIGDSQSMAHSVESRLPFMDYRLVEFLAEVPATYKIHNGWTKYIARLAMSKYLPHTIAWRRDKKGWPDPAEYWFRGPLKEWLCQEIESSEFLRGFAEPSDIKRRVEGKEDIYNLIRYLNLAIWHRIFFENPNRNASRQSIRDRMK